MNKKTRTTNDGSCPHSYIGTHGCSINSVFTQLPAIVDRITAIIACVFFVLGLNIVYCNSSHFRNLLRREAFGEHVLDD